MLHYKTKSNILSTSRKCTLYLTSVVLHSAKDATGKFQTRITSEGVSDMGKLNHGIGAWLMNCIWKTKPPTSFKKYIFLFQMKVL